MWNEKKPAIPAKHIQKLQNGVKEGSPGLGNPEGMTQPWVKEDLGGIAEKTHLLGKCSKGLLFIISGPAGTGKTTLINKIVDEFNQVLDKAITYTTRPPRQGEIQGTHYYFISEQEFERKIANGEFIEYVTLYGNYYGTSVKSIQVQLDLGRHIILVIDTQGALQLKKKLSGVFIFLQPPSLEILRERLTERKTETPEKIEERLRWAKKELEVAKQYDYCIVNDSIQAAYHVLSSIIIAETHKLRS